MNNISGIVKIGDGRLWQEILNLKVIICEPCFSRLRNHRSDGSGNFCDSQTKYGIGKPILFSILINSFVHKNISDLKYFIQGFNLTIRGKNEVPKM